jgi:lipopolysaccharide transport system ATP-binding protein
MTRPLKQKALFQSPQACPAGQGPLTEGSLGDAAVVVSNLSKNFAVNESAGARLKRVLSGGPLPANSVSALDGVCFSVARGETLGIVGENGSGKSTLLKILAGIQRPDKGGVTVRGKMATLLELGVGFDPEFTGRENVYLADALMGFSAKDVEARIESIAAFADIGPFLDQPVRTYSAGMRVRLAFATAIHAEPEVLVIDEVLAVGDAAFQRKCFSRIRQMQQQGVTIIFVSHDMNNTVQIAKRVLMLDEGRIMAIGEPKSVVSFYERFSFAPPAEKIALRQKARSGGPEQPACQPYDNGAEPVARTPLVYSSQGAVIENPRITDESGNPVRTLAIGRTYHYSYNVVFTRAASNVRMGMMMVAPSGLSLSGQVSHPPGRGFEAALGQRVEQSFCFECRLAPGVYFANAGVTASEGTEEIYLHRIVDALTFKVEAKPEPLFTGLVDLSCKQGKNSP